MFDILDKYRQKDHFFLNPTDSLEEKCNAPDKKDGVYLVYELKRGHITLVYVGSSGDRSIAIVNDGLYGLKQSIINGPKAEKGIRAQDWPVKMLAENIDALDIYWWATYYGQLKDHPEMVQNKILDIHWRLYGRMPAWNINLSRRRR